MPPTFQNLGFEIPGPAPGLAAGWTLVFQSSAEEIAGYGTPERPQEDYEGGWSGNEDFVFAFTASALEPALYDDAPESVEDFNEGWSENESFLRELVSVAPAEYGPGPKLVEDFDELWTGNESFLFAFAPSDLATTSLEAFEGNWLGNQSFVFAFEPADLVAAVYDGDGGGEPVEDFEDSWPTLAMTTA